MRLTREEQALLKTRFPSEIEKEAAAEVNAAVELYSMGFEKMAAQAADTLDNYEFEGETEKVAFDQEMEKSARENGALIARGYIDGLLKEGSERHGDELHFLYPFIAEKTGASMEGIKAFFGKSKGGVKEFSGKAWKKTKELGEKGWGKTRDYHKGMASDIMTGITGKRQMGKLEGITEKVEGKERWLTGLRGLGKATPHAAVAGGIGYATHKKFKKKNQEQEQEQE